jgi:hypothetical protein
MKPADKATRREARLAERLKANLARRKDQARSREGEDGADGAAARPATSPLRGSPRDEEKENPSSR